MNKIFDTNKAIKQKTIFNYNVKDIMSKISVITTMSGGQKRIFTLRSCAGTSVFFTLLSNTDDYLLIESGLHLIKLMK